MSNERQAALCIAVGTNGTGKTSRLKELLEVNERNLIVPSGRDDAAWKGIPALEYRTEYQADPMNPKRQVPVVVIPELHTFTGNRVLHVDGNVRVFDAVTHQVNGFRNGGLFLDDFRNYIFSKGTLSTSVNALFINRRHRMVDIFMACHGFEDVSRDLLRFNPTLFIFRTTLPPNEASVEKVANSEAFLQAVARVNRRAQADPYYFERFQPAM